MGEPIPYSTFIAETLAALTIGTVLVLQWLLSCLERITSKRRHLQQIMNAAFRETALLGITALILFVIQFSSDIDDVAIHELEILHICVWVVAVVYLFWVVVLMLFSARIGKRWAGWETHFAFQSEAYKKTLSEAREEFERMRRYAPGAVEPDKDGSFRAFRLILLVLRYPISAVRYFSRIHVVRYIQLRRRFISKYGLPADFTFWMYLNECKQHVFLKLVELPVILWGVIVYAVSLDLYLRTIWDWYQNTISATVIIVLLALGGLLISAAVFFKMRSVSWIIIHREYNLAGDVPDAGSWQAESADGIPAGDMQGGTEREAAIQQMGSFQGAAPAEIRRAITVAAGRGTGSQMAKDKSLFWFGLPILLIHLLQLALFAETASVSLVVVSFSDTTVALSSILWSILSIVLAAGLCLALLSSIVPLYVLSIHVSDIVDVRLLAEAVILHEKTRRRRRRSVVENSNVEGDTSKWKRALDSSRKVFLSHTMQVAVSFAILVDFFLISLIASDYLSKTLRTVLFSIDFLLVGFIAAELLARISLTGWSRYFALRPLSTWLWNIVDITLVALAIAATVVSAANGLGTAVAPNDRGAALYLAPLLAIRLLRSGLVLHVLRPSPEGHEEPGVATISRGGSFTSMRSFASVRHADSTVGFPPGASDLDELANEQQTVLGPTANEEIMAQVDQKAEALPDDNLNVAVATRQAAKQHRKFMFSHSTSETVDTLPSPDSSRPANSKEDLRDFGIGESLRHAQDTSLTGLESVLEELSQTPTAESGPRLPAAVRQHIRDRIDAAMHPSIEEALAASDAAQSANALQEGGQDEFAEGGDR